jgi:hypothetical protein
MRKSAAWRQRAEQHTAALAGIGLPHQAQNLVTPEGPSSVPAACSTGGAPTGSHGCIVHSAHQPARAARSWARL